MIANSGTKFVVMMLATLLGGLIGEFLQLEKRLEKTIALLTARVQRSDQQPNSEAKKKFTHAFLSSTILYCVGPMAILGALQDGLKDDPPCLSTNLF